MKRLLKWLAVTTGVPSNTSRYYLERFVARAAASLRPGAVVLDAGAGDSPYRGYFAHVHYESADFCAVEKKYAAVTYECDLATVPVEDCRYDGVVLTQVLEHLPRPGMVLNELFRILKPGGTLWLSAPLFYEEHEVPFDFYRYTQYGLRFLLEEAGFEVTEVEWLEGYFGTMSYQLERCSRHLPVSSKVYGGGLSGHVLACCAFAIRPILLIGAFVFRWVDYRSKITTAGYCKNYVVIANRPKCHENG